MRPSPTFIRLLVVLLLLQWGSAFAHCLKLAAPAGGLLHMEICTSEGLRSIAVPDPDAPPAEHAVSAICPVCGSLGQAMLPAPSVMPVPALLLVQSPAPPPPSTPSPAPPPRCQPPPRAPPVS